MILLDTNVLSELMKASPNRQVLDWVDHHPPADLWARAISKAEIALGIALLPSGKRQDALALAADANAARLPHATTQCAANFLSALSLAALLTWHN